MNLRIVLRERTNLILRIVLQLLVLAFFAAILWAVIFLVNNSG